MGNRSSATILTTALALSCTCLFFASNLIGLASASNSEMTTTEILTVQYAGKEYPIVYSSTAIELQDVRVSQYILTLIIDANQNGIVDITLPYNLIKTFWPDLSSSRSSLLEVDVDGEFVKFDQVMVGSLITYSFEVPQGAEQVSLSGTIIPADIPSITVGSQAQWNNPGSIIRIDGKLWNVDSEGVLIYIAVKDALRDEVWNGTARTNQTGDFTAEFSMPGVAMGGSYEIVARIVQPSELQETSGYGFFYVNSPGFYNVEISELTREVIHISSNSTSYAPFVLVGHKSLGILVTGENTTFGSAQLIVPHSVLSGNLAMVDGLAEITANSTHSIVKLKYEHETMPTIVTISGTSVIPEFGPPLIILAGVVVSIVVFSVRRNGRTSFRLGQQLT